MEVTLHNELSGCPEGCPNLRLKLEGREIAGVVYAFIDCYHSEACAMWDSEKEGDMKCKGSSRD